MATKKELLNKGLWVPKSMTAKEAYATEYNFDFWNDLTADDIKDLIDYMKSGKFKINETFGHAELERWFPEIFGERECLGSGGTQTQTWGTYIQRIRDWEIHYQHIQKTSGKEYYKLLRVQGIPRCKQIAEMKASLPAEYHRLAGM